MRSTLLRIFVAVALTASVSSRVFAQMHSEVHEEREDLRQEDVVKNMHFADDVLKNKFLEVYVPYQERLFHIDHQFRDLVNVYMSAQSNGKIMSGDRARELLNRGLSLQRARDANLTNYVNRLKVALPGGVALQAWLIENKLRAASASAFLNAVPFVTQ